MITVGMSTVIESPSRRVWRALTVPEEVIRWDERVLALRDPVSGYPAEVRARLDAKNRGRTEVFRNCGLTLFIG